MHGSKKIPCNTFVADQVASLSSCSGLYSLFGTGILKDTIMLVRILVLLDFTLPSELLGTTVLL